MQHQLGLAHPAETISLPRRRHSTEPRRQIRGSRTRTTTVGSLTIGSNEPTWSSRASRCSSGSPPSTRAPESHQSSRRSADDHVALFTLPPRADTADMRGAGIASVFERPHSGLAFLGIVIVSLTSIVGSGFSLLSLPFALWSMLPYGVLWLVGRALRDWWLALGAGTAALAADIGIRAAVFLWPRGSTAAIALVFSPAYIAAIVMPIGAGAGWLLGRMWRWHAAGRVVAITLARRAGSAAARTGETGLCPQPCGVGACTQELIGPPRSSRLGLLRIGASVDEGSVVRGTRSRRTTRRGTGDRRSHGRGRAGQRNACRSAPRSVRR